jgi:hypothetical protein
VGHVIGLIGMSFYRSSTQIFSKTQISSQKVGHVIRLKGISFSNQRNPISYQTLNLSFVVVALATKYNVCSSRFSDLIWFRVITHQQG